mgnify:CR=1 FL=1
MQNELIKNIIKIMKNKTFRGSERKLNKIENYRKHFGWETVDRDYDKLVMSYDKDKPNAGALRKLEKQASIINSHFPKKMIVWLALTVFFLVPYLFYKDGVIFGFDLKAALNSIDFIATYFPFITNIIVYALPILLLVLISINAFFASYQLLVFGALKISKRTTLEEIYRVADALSGNVIDAPLPGNIEPDGKYTGFIAILCDKIGNRAQ